MLLCTKKIKTKIFVIKLSDPWLLKNKRICPQCRKRVFSRGSGYSGDSDDSDSTTNERSALIRPNNR